MLTSNKLLKIHKEMSFHCKNPECNEVKCCVNGYKLVWPYLEGVDAHQAKDLIERDNPEVTVEFVPRGKSITKDFCCNRVWVFVDNNGRVEGVPMVG
ncbi:hypothetical protein ACJIZ3_025004 [Penstemon smallii]|uniref:Proteinase inhibitor n=1 Tax=Penstemon smallii TaxID=265156 RepID=A0ABD3TVM1_9LAMI